MSAWNQGLPDSDTTVFARLNDEEWPITAAFHDGECWRAADAMELEVGDNRVLGWMHMDAAAAILDREVAP